MKITSFGDMAQSQYLRMRNMELKQQVASLGQELSTGKTSDLTGRLGADFTYLADVERNLARMDSYDVTVMEATLFASSAQDYLMNINTNVTDLRANFLTFGTYATAENADQMAGDSRLYLRSSISAMNGSAGGRNLFAGTATDTEPLNDVDTLMSALVTEVTGLTTAADVAQAVKDWFDDPAGFDAVMYNGSTNSLAPVQVGPSDQISLDLRADDPDVKFVLQAFAIGAIGNEAGLSFSDEIKTDLVNITTSELQESEDRVINLRADVGFAQGRIEEVSTRNLAAKTSLGLAKNSLIEADPYETFTRLEEAQTQLESLYTVTVRSSQLSLLRFMS